MSEIVFPCNCGMILKVYGDDQVGQGLVCPSCGGTVIVPAVGIKHDASPISVDFQDSQNQGPAPARSAVGKWFGLAYFTGIAVVTAILIKVVLMPALATPVAVAKPETAKPVATEDSPKTTSTGADADDTPRRLLKRPKSRTAKADDGADVADSAKRSEPRTPITAFAPKTRPATPTRLPGRTLPVPTGGGDAPAEAAPPDDPDGEVAANPLDEIDKKLRGMIPTPEDLVKGLGALARPPAGFGRGFGVPAGPGRGMPRSPLTPPKGRRPAPSKSSTPADESEPETDDAAKTELAKDVTKPGKKAAAKKAPYDHIANKEVRALLEYADRNTTDILATSAAENFLALAEKAAGGDPNVMVEIEKLRRKIAVIRNDP
jgi:hypothetical protein